MPSLSIAKIPSKVTPIRWLLNLDPTRRQQRSTYSIKDLLEIYHCRYHRETPDQGRYITTTLILPLNHFQITIKV